MKRIRPTGLRAAGLPLCLGFCLSLGLSLRAQQSLRPASGEERQAMMEQIAQASQRMKTLVCDFEQRKTLSVLNDEMLSHGKMYYRNDRRLRWEYRSPYRYTFVLNDRTILMQAEDSRNVIDVNSSGFLREIVNVMMSGINGGGPADSKRFDARYYKQETPAGLWEVHLFPLQREMKQMFASIKLTFNAKDHTVEQVEMNERGGDTTVVRLLAKQINEEIEDDTFHIH